MKKYFLCGIILQNSKGVRKNVRRKETQEKISGLNIALLLIIASAIYGIICFANMAIQMGKDPRPEFDDEDIPSVSETIE